MKDLFVVTHTQSVHHLENKVGGWYDTGLSPRGEIDARATAERLAGVVGGGDAEIISSYLLRASQTAAIIAKRLQRPVIETADLREISYGSAGGMPDDWLAARQTPAPDDNRMDHRGGIDDAATRRDIAIRVYRCLESIVERPCEADHRDAWLCVDVRHRSIDQDASQCRRICEFRGAAGKHHAPASGRLLEEPFGHQSGRHLPSKSGADGWLTFPHPLAG